MQAAPARFNRGILLVAVLLLLGLLGLLAYGKQFLRLSSLGLGLNVTNTTKPPSSAVRLPESLKPQPHRAGVVAVPTSASAESPEGGQASLGAASTTPPPPPGLGQAQPQTRPDTSRVPIARLVEDTQGQQERRQGTQQTQQGQQTVQQGQEKQKRTPWIITPTDIGIKRQGGTPTKREQEDSARKAEAQNLIQPAKWARPKYPTKTLYRSMVLPGRLLDNINSDIPASTIRITLTVPILDKFGRGDIILDKGSIVISKQEGRAEFGQSRIPLKLEQIELPTGEIVTMKAMTGDEHAAAGVPGKVHTHLGKLLLATGINAVLNIGLSSAVGTPGQGNFYQNPAQQAAQEAGRAAANDINTIVSKQLKVPPTIEVKAGQIVSISLEENVQFNRPPVIAR